MRISFDPAKRNKTIEERGLDFAEAGKVFSGRHVTMADDREDYGERRYITIGYLSSRMIVVVWTERDGTRRIVSMRKANEREQKIYTPGLG